MRFVALFLLIGCRSIPATSQSECLPPPEGDSGAVPLDALMQLAGKYRFVTVATSRGVDHSSFSGELTLRVADTLERYYERRRNSFVRAGNRPLVGHLAWPEPSGKVRTEPAVVQQNPGGTQMISGFCVNCLDGMLAYYGISQIRANGFSGRWHDPQTGIGKIVDKNGRALPDPEGYFCAIRIS
jgi:hypothetical protein